MNSRKILFSLLAGAALTTVTGILLTPYKDASKRKKIADKLNVKMDETKEAIKETLAMLRIK